jgi:hypothetical protein
MGIGIFFLVLVEIRNIEISLNFGIFISISFHDTYSLNIATFKNFIRRIKKILTINVIYFHNYCLIKKLENLWAPFGHILLDIHIIHQFNTNLDSDTSY